jgi:hypothetical protein
MTGAATVTVTMKASTMSFAPWLTTAPFPLLALNVPPGSIRRYHGGVLHTHPSPLTLAHGSSNVVHNTTLEFDRP